MLSRGQKVRITNPQLAHDRLLNRYGVIVRVHLTPKSSWYSIKLTNERDVFDYEEFECVEEDEYEVAQIMER